MTLDELLAELTSPGPELPPEARKAAIEQQARQLLREHDEGLRRRAVVHATAPASGCLRATDPTATIPD